MMKSMNKVRQNQRRKYISQDKHSSYKSQIYKVDNKPFSQPNISKKELEKIKSEIRAKGKRQRIIENSIITIITLVVFSLIYFYFF